MRLFTRGVLALLIGTGVTASAQPPAPPAGPPGPPALPAPTGVTPPAPAPRAEPRPTGTAATVTSGANTQAIPEVAVYRALRQINPAHHEMARKEIVNHLIENTLVDQYLVAIQVKVSDQDVENLIGDLKKELGRDKKDYAQELEVMLLTEQEFRAEVQAQMRWEAFVKQQATDAALKNLFDGNPDIFDGTQVRARHILMTPGTDPEKQKDAAGKLRGIKQVVEAEAKKASDATTGEPLAKAQAAAKKSDELFAAYAKEYSGCPSKQNGGDLNFFPRAGAMVEPFAKAAFETRPGAMTEVVATEFGYHLILVTDRKEGKRRQFEEVKEDVRLLFAMRLREAVLGQMKPKAQITINPAPRYPAPVGVPAPAPVGAPAGAAPVGGPAPTAGPGAVPGPGPIPAPPAPPKQ
ncbi:MAG TPA: peptidyl-prolyl cis-trans isomerase [Urbifossiella sp.]|jgi:peptidyl-prolyl cis-trans isomerase C|nr:peptidyl-prolyl cis-trans isomerase [Urbifossiella sp.]